MTESWWGSRRLRAAAAAASAVGISFRLLCICAGGAAASSVAAAVDFRQVDRQVGATELHPRFSGASRVGDMLTWTQRYKHSCQLRTSTILL